MKLEQQITTKLRRYYNACLLINQRYDDGLIDEDEALEQLLNADEHFTKRILSLLQEKH